MRKILFYRTKAGKCPVEEFLNTLSDKETAKIAWVLRVVRDLTNPPSSYIKKLKNSKDIWEIRVSIGNNIFRFLGFYDGPQLIILTNGFRKKSQKTPKNEIKLAEKRKQEYLSWRN